MDIIIVELNQNLFENYSRLEKKKSCLATGIF